MWPIVLPTWLPGAIVCKQCEGNGVNSVDHFNGRFKAGGTCWLCRYILTDKFTCHTDLMKKKVAHTSTVMISVTVISYL